MGILVPSASPSHAQDTGWGIARGLEQGRRLAVDKAEFNIQITAARQRYWSAYPDGAGFKEAEAEYMELLAQKDFYYIVPCLVGGVEDGLRTMKGFDVLSGGFGMDGGPRDNAMPALREMVNGIRKSAGLLPNPGSPPSFNQLLIIPSERSAKAIAANQEAIDAYIAARNRAEMKVSLDLVPFKTSRDYLAARLWLDGTVESVEEAEDDMRELEDIVGTQRLDAIAAQIRKLPKDGDGELTKIEWLGPYDAPRGRTLTHDVLDRHLGHDDARVYAISMIRAHRRVSWPEARDLYEQYWIEPFGEDVVLAAAERIRTAPKKRGSPSRFGGLVQGIEGESWPQRAFVRLMPHNPYRDLPLGSLDETDPRPYLHALLKTGGGVEYWDQTPAAYEALVEKWGEKPLHEAALKIMSAEKTADGRIASPAELGASPVDPFEALTQLLQQGSQTPRLYFADLLRELDADGGPDYYKTSEPGAAEYDMLVLCFGQEHIDGIITTVRDAHDRGVDLTTLPGAVSGFDQPAQVIYDILWATSEPEALRHYMLVRTYASTYRYRPTPETLNRDVAKAREIHKQQVAQSGREAILAAVAMIGKARKLPFTLTRYRENPACPVIADPTALGLPAAKKGSAKEASDAWRREEESSAWREAEDQTQAWNDWQAAVQERREWEQELAVWRCFNDLLKKLRR